MARQPHHQFDEAGASVYAEFGVDALRLRSPVVFWQLMLRLRSDVPNSTYPIHELTGTH
jgi:hypothetical protein